MIVPTGKLISIGGNEDKGTEQEPDHLQRNNLNFFSLQILSRIVHESGSGKKSRIEVITSASSIPEELGDIYLQAFEKIGCRNVGVMQIRTREQAQNAANVERVAQSDVVMFTGGNQLRLTTIFGGTKILRLLHQRYLEDNFVIAGTSAGAMAMSNPMIYQGSSTDALLKGQIKITTGLGFLKDVIIDSHFMKRGRFGRLSQAVVANPSCLGIGLGEDTDVIVTNGNLMEAIGSGQVVLVDGQEILHSNIADLKDGSPIFIENIVVHIMAKGNFYDLRERKFFVDHPMVVQRMN